MSAPAAPVVPATTAEAVRLSHVMAAAFAADPVSDWLFDGEQDAHHPAFFQAFLRQALTGGRVDQTVDGTGLAIWLDRTRAVDPVAAARTADEIALAVGRHTARWQQLAGGMDAAHPDRPHWYLAFLGVMPGQHHRGHGHRLLCHAASWLDGAPTYLEATSRRLVQFYERHGYQRFREVQVTGGPALHAMWHPGAVGAPPPWPIPVPRR